MTYTNIFSLYKPVNLQVTCNYFKTYGWRFAGQTKIYFCRKMVIRVDLVEFRGFKMQHFKGQKNNLVKLSKSLIRLDRDPATP